MMIGTVLCARRRRHTSRPSSFGRMRSSTTRATRSLPPACGRTDAAALAAQLALRFPSRIPGTPAADAAGRWFAQQLAPYGYAVTPERFSADVPGRGHIRLTNLVVEKRGLSHKTIVVL